MCVNKKARRGRSVCQWNRAHWTPCCLITQSRQREGRLGDRLHPRCPSFFFYPPFISTHRTAATQLHTVTVLITCTFQYMLEIVCFLWETNYIDQQTIMNSKLNTKPGISIWVSPHTILQLHLYPVCKGLVRGKRQCDTRDNTELK